MRKSGFVIDEIYKELKPKGKCFLCIVEALSRHPLCTARELRNSVRMVKFRRDHIKKLDDIFACCIPSKDINELNKRLDIIDDTKGAPWNAQQA